MASRNASNQRNKSKGKRSVSRGKRSGKIARSSDSSTPLSETAQEETSPRRSPGYIPDVVSQRMVRRVALFCGIPTCLGLASFVLNYVLIVRYGVNLPPYLTLVETLALFGAGFVGITYGVLSASWEPYPGSALGWSEFRTNLGNMIQQWREYGAQKRKVSVSDQDTTE